MALVDEAFHRFEQLKAEIVTSLESAATEADARFRSIDRFLKEILKWEADAVRTEPRAGTGYADYVLSAADGRSLFVIEAKKSGALPVTTGDKKFNEYQLSGPVLKPIEKVISQAVDYCVDKGVPIAAVTDGQCWVFFRALRTDGKPIKSGTAVVFPNIDEIGNHFSEFFDLLSKYGILNLQCHARINSAEGIRGNSAEHHYFLRPPSAAVLGTQTDLARDLGDVFREFFTRMASETDAAMLRDCFVDSRESLNANDQLEKILLRLTQNIEPLETSQSIKLVRQLEGVIETQRSEIALIVGNKGSGKSTFIDRFFTDILKPQLREKCATCAIDLSQYSGGPEGDVQRWISTRLIEILEQRAFGDSLENADYDDYEGIFYSTYQRWRSTTFSHLYTTDKTTFKIKFGQHLEEMRTAHPTEYAFELLKNFVRSRKLIPCIVFDNTDQFSTELQHAVFQYAVAVRKQVASLSVIPITDRSIWRMSRAGPIQSEVSFTFFLPVPEPDKIIARRVEYVRQQIELEKKSSGQYFARKGIKVTIQSLEAFASIIEAAFLKSPDVIDLVAKLANYEIRRMLGLAQQIILSHSFDVEDLVKIRLSGQEVHVDYNRVIRALIIGGYDRFVEEGSDYIKNLFWVDALSPETPILMGYILRHLGTIADYAGAVTDKYIPVSSVISYFEQTGAHRDNILRMMQSLFDFRLVESFDPSDEQINVDSSAAITSAGRVHLELMLTNPAYLQEMAMVTGIRYQEAVDRLEQLRIRFADPHARQEFNKAFVEYLLGQDNEKSHLPNGDSYRDLFNFRRGFQQRWTVRTVPKLARVPKEPVGKSSRGQRR